MGAPNVSAEAWRTVLRFLPSLRIRDDMRAELQAGIEAILAARTVLQFLGGGAWRIGQGESVSVYTARVPEALAIAYEAMRRGEACFAGCADDAMRNRLRRTAGWLERVAKAPLLANRLRRLRVCAGRVIDPYAAYGRVL